MIIDDEDGVRIIGPVCEKKVGQVEESCLTRDVLFMQEALDHRAWDEPEGDDSRDQPVTALLYATILNQAVPDRFKLSDGEIIHRIVRYAGTPKRQLLKEVYRGWRSLGVNPPGGKILPPLRIGKAKVELLVHLIQQWKDGRLDVLGCTVEELADEIEAVILDRELAPG